MSDIQVLCEALAAASGEPEFTIDPQDLAQIDTRLDAADALAKALEPFAAIWDNPMAAWPIDADYEKASIALRQYEEAKREQQT